MAKNRSKPLLPKPTFKEVIIQMVIPGVLGASIYAWSWQSFSDDVTVLDTIVDVLIFFSVWMILQILIHRKRIFQK
mgnify:FL=1